MTQQTLLHIALSNAAVAAVLAVVALAVTIAFRRPALSHAAWLLVLLKLLTPPLFTVPVEWPQTAVSTIAPQRIVEPWVAPEADLSQQIEAGLLRDEPIVNDATEAQPLAAEATIAPPAVEAPTAWARVRPHWALVLVSAWASGSSMVLVLIASRLYRFRRILRRATPASGDVHEQVRILCDDLDIRPAPSVSFVPGGVCPMLIGFGPASRILVPRELWWHLDARQRATLLVHELAHLRRGDQWVRLIELLVTVVYWWNPVAWFARRELREAEEQCCDAWVVWAMPHSARDYAVALMEAIDSTTRARPVAVPVLGSGMGEFHHLRRRLIMIKQGKVARALTWSGFGAMCGVGALLLPLSPTLALDATPVQETPAADAFEVVERLDGIEGVAVVEEVAAEPVPAPGAENAEVRVTADPADPWRVQLQVEAQQAQAAQQAQQAEQQALNAELQATREMIKQLSRELERAHARLAELEARRGGGGGGGGFRPGGMAWERFVIPRRIEPGAVPSGGMPRTVKPVQPVQPKSPPQAGVAPRTESRPKAPAARRAPARAEGKTDRLDALEERLAALLNEVRSLKQERKDDWYGEGKPGNALPPPTTPAPAR